jgi:hypothetical protein
LLATAKPALPVFHVYMGKDLRSVRRQVGVLERVDE